jgi:hypothetical protein
MSLASLGPFITNLTDKLFQPLFFSLISWTEVDTSNTHSNDDEIIDITKLTHYRKEMFYRVVVKLIDLLQVF